MKSKYKTENRGGRASLIKKQKELHPRTKKLTGTVLDSQEKKTIYC